MNFDRRTFLHGLGAGALGALTGCATASTASSSRTEVPTYMPADAAAFWRAVRALFPLLDSPVYLNTGGLGPVSQRVLDTVAATTLRLQEHSETGHDLLKPSREVMARFLGAQPDEVCFVRNATEGNSIVAAGLALEPGDEVIFETHAHPGGSYPWLNQARRRGVKVVLFEPDPSSPEGNLARVQDLVSPRTRVIQVSHITCTTGLVFPLREIADFARSRGIWFHVDGAQAAGMIPLDLRALGCDSYALSGHKWLGGPHETGVLFLRREQLDAVALSGAGAYSGELPRLPGELVLADAASRHEYGTRNAGLITGLAEATRLQEEIGRDRIAAHGRELAAFVADECARVDGIEVLTPRPETMRASMTTIRHARAGAHRLFEYLFKRHDLRCRVVTEQGLEALRISTHVFTSRADCERIVAAVRQSVRDL
jgi:selenocysteine lyase/cysteine desulfurase